MTTSTLKSVCREFIERSSRKIELGALPVEPKERTQTPLIPVSRWRYAAGVLNKEYEFRSIEHRNAFIVTVLAYESYVGHNAKFSIDANKVCVSLTTENVGKATELDREYATHCDVTFREIAYNHSHGLESPTTAKDDDEPCSSRQNW